MKTNVRLTPLFLRSVLGLGLIALPLVLKGQLYTAVDLGTLGGLYTLGSGLNNSGTVVGYSTTPREAHAFSYSDGIMTDLGTLPGGTGSYATAVNNRGTAVGRVSTPVDYMARAFFSSNGAVIELGAGGIDTPPTISRVAHGINDSGTIVGYATLSYGNRAFYYSDGNMTFLGTLGGDSSIAYGINQAGTIVGMSALVGNSATHAFSYNGGTVNDLGTLGGSFSVAYGLNEGGAIVGTASLPDERTSHAFSFSNGAMIDLGNIWGPGGSIARAINNAGVIVGAANINYKSTHAMIYHDGAMTDLNSLVDLPGIELRDATAINDLGQIVANGGSAHTYLLTPIAVPEPSTYAFTFTWLVLTSCLIYRRRKRTLVMKLEYGR